MDVKLPICSFFSDLLQSRVRCRLKLTVTGDYVCWDQGTRLVYIPAERSIAFLLIYLAHTRTIQQKSSLKKFKRLRSYIEKKT